MWPLCIVIQKWWKWYTKGVSSGDRGFPSQRMNIAELLFFPAVSLNKLSKKTLGWRFGTRWHSSDIFRICFIVTSREISKSLRSYHGLMIIRPAKCAMKFLIHSQTSAMKIQWASSTGLTAVSKFKTRPPAQWVVGTHRKGPSRMEKVTFRMNWPIRNSTQTQIRI